MTENRSHKLKNQNLKTEMSFTSKIGEVEMGKLVRLPYIRKISTNNQYSYLQRKSLENKETRIMRKSNKELQLFEHSYLNMLTLQEIQLCKDNNRDNQGLPKINHHNHLILNRERSIESLQNAHFNRAQKSLSKLDMTQKIKDFKLGPIIGKGTYSVVRAGKSKQAKKVAIKTYMKSSLSSEDRRKNLQNQIKVLQILQHPSILSFIETIETEETINIVTELLQNRSLADYARSECFNIVREDIAKFMIKHLLKAIAYCHSKDIVHRDIKMENILINKQYKPKLIDFGFSLQLPRENYVLYDYCGTPNYIAPEIIQREGYYGKPADIWALGVVIYKMVTGTFPFKAINDKAAYLKAMKTELRIPHELSPELCTLLNQLLSFDFKKRPKADEILASDWLAIR